MYAFFKKGGMKMKDIITSLVMEAKASMTEQEYTKWVIEMIHEGTLGELSKGIQPKL
jgi:hypothetical protein